MLNALIRFGYRCAYRAARVWWFVARPATWGAVVAVWSGDRLLLVRTCYRSLATLPGGFVNGSETRPQAAVRELREEIGLHVDPAALRWAWEGVKPLEYRQDGVTIFELEVPEPIDVVPNQRELVWAAWKTRDEALAMRLSSHLREYLEKRI